MSMLIRIDPYKDHAIADEVAFWEITNELYLRMYVDSAETEEEREILQGKDFDSKLYDVICGIRLAKK